MKSFLNELSIELLETIYELSCPHLDERQRRLLASSYAIAIGRGGISAANRITGVSRVTLTKGVKEIMAKPIAGHRSRQVGAGRKALSEKDPAFLNDLKELVGNHHKESEDNPKKLPASTYKLAAEMKAKGHNVSEDTISKYLKLHKLPARTKK
jgi:hypothetical protein